MIALQLEPVTAEAFAPYGDLLAGPGARDRLDHAARIENGRPGARANVLLAKGRPAARPRVLAKMERHAFSSQLFVPLEGTAYFGVVAKDDGQGRPDLATLRAFLVPGSAGINLAAGTWHAPLATLDREGGFVVLVHEDGTADDCHWIDVPEIRIDIPPA